MLFLLLASAFAGKPADLSNPKAASKYMEERSMYGSGSFKKHPVAGRPVVMMDWVMNWDFDIQQAKKMGVVGDVELDQAFFERATEEVYAQWRQRMEARGIVFRDKSDLQSLERWKKATDKFGHIEVDRRREEGWNGFVRLQVHPDGYKPYGKGVGGLTRMVKVYNSMSKELEPEAVLWGNVSVALCMVKDRKTKEKKLHPCLGTAVSGGTRGEQAMDAVFKGFEPMRFQLDNLHRNPKYELGQVGALTPDGTLTWGMNKTATPFILTADQVVNPPTPEISLIHEFTEGEAAFVQRLCEVLLTAEEMSWGGVNSGLEASQAKWEKKNKR